MHASSRARPAPEAPGHRARARSSDGPGPGLRRPAAPLVLGWAGLAVTVLLVAVALAAAPTAASPGLPDPGPWPGWGLPVLRLAGHGAALAVVGVLLVGALGGPAPRWGLLVPLVLARAAVAAGGVLLGLAEVVGRPVGAVLQVDLLRFYLTQVPQGVAAGRVLALSLLLAVVASALARWTTSPVRTDRSPAATPRRSTVRPLPAAVPVAVLVLALAVEVPPLLAGHSAAATDHDLAVALLVLHVLPALLWVGGLAALVVVLRDGGGAAAAVLGRYSTLALVCAVAVGASGLASALVREGRSLLGPELVTTGSGVLLLAKTVGFVVVVGFGWWHRNRGLRDPVTPRPAWARVAAVEVAVMVVTFALATVLARTAG